MAASGGLEILISLTWLLSIVTKGKVFNFQICP